MRYLAESQAMRYNPYELGKWYGDRVGFPRVGLVNKSPRMIHDTYDFLRTLVQEHRIHVEIQRRSDSISIASQRSLLAQIMKVPEQRIFVVTNRHMYGEFAYRVYTQSRVLFREFEVSCKGVLQESRIDKIMFLAGLADAEATVDKRNILVSFSVSSKKLEDVYMFSALFESLNIPIRIRTAGKREIKIDVLDMKAFEIIAMFMQHEEKRARLKELEYHRYMLPKDGEIAALLEGNKNIKTSELAVKFGMHQDSIRRIKRLWLKQNRMAIL